MTKENDEVFYMKIISINKAKNLRLKRYFTGKPCKYGHVSERYLSSKACVFCDIKYSEKTKDLRSYRESKYYQYNKKAIRDQQARYAKENPEIFSFKSANRRSAKIQRTPKWNTEEDYKAIEYFYVAAKWLTKTTGYVFNVDHIIPLQAEKASGLHVPANLQIMTASANHKKKNKFEIT